MSKKYYVVYKKSMDACCYYLANAYRGKKVKYRPLRSKKKSAEYIKSLQRSRVKQETMREYNAWFQEGCEFMMEAGL